jgi:hypothetical protein
MPKLSAIEFQTGEAVLRLDCLGNLCSDNSDSVIVEHWDVGEFISWLATEHRAFVKFAKDGQ